MQNNVGIPAFCLGLWSRRQGTCCVLFGLHALFCKEIFNPYQRMSAIIGPCAVCKSPSKLRCAGCHLTSYCGRDHQKSDWSLHKQQCCAYEIHVTQKLGRHLVASKDLKEGDLIVTQNPSVVGPTEMSSLYSCVGCYRGLKQLKVTCPRCHLPACGKYCPGLTDPAGHALECAVFRTEEIPYNYFGWPGMALFLRCLLLRKANPEMWQTIQEKAPFAAAKRFTKISHRMTQMLGAMKPVLEKLAATAPELLQDISLTTLTSVIDVLDAHAFDISLNADDKIVALYPIASLLQTSCAPNTRVTFLIERKSQSAVNDNRMGRVTVKAARNITKGEILTWTIGPTTMTTLARQGYLSSTRNMLCYCSRCLDPTELGSNFGTIRCTTCSGWILPVNPSNIIASNWKCSGNCGTVISRDIAASRQVILQDVLSRLLLYKICLSAFEGLLKNFEGTFHPNNWSCMHLKRVMMKAYSIPPILFENRKHFTATLDTFGIERNPSNRIPDSQLKRKAELCRDILDILSQVCGCVHPDDLLTTADVLLNLASAEAEMMKRTFEAGKSSRNVTMNALVACHDLLKRAEEFLNMRAIKTAPKRRLGTLTEDIPKEMRSLLNWGAMNGMINFEEPPAKVRKLA